MFRAGLLVRRARRVPADGVDEVPLDSGTDLPALPPLALPFGGVAALGALAAALLWEVPLVEFALPIRPARRPPTLLAALRAL